MTFKLKMVFIFLKDHKKRHKEELETESICGGARNISWCFTESAAPL
jgi:hypothetical protein